MERRGKMRERVRRIKATWDGEIEFKSAANKWCTQLTCASRKRRRRTHNEGQKQTCYQGLERGAEPFNNFLSAPKWKHKRGEKWRFGCREFEPEERAVLQQISRWLEAAAAALCPSENHVKHLSVVEQSSTEISLFHRLAGKLKHDACVHIQKKKKS